MIFLAISLLSLPLAPLLARATARAPVSLALLDGFVFTGLGGLIALHILPESFELAGPWALLAAAIGVFGPGLAEARLERAAGPSAALAESGTRSPSDRAHTGAILLVAFGLGFHALLDGVALASPSVTDTPDARLLALAVVLHRLPLALTLWWLLRPALGLRFAAGYMVFDAACTTLGYAVGDTGLRLLSNAWLGAFGALVAGSLLHVVIHRPAPGTDPARSAAGATVGSLVGLLLLFAVPSAPADPVALDATSRAVIFLELAREYAPALVLAYIVAALLRAQKRGPEFEPRLMSSNRLKVALAATNLALRSALECREPFPSLDRNLSRAAAGPSLAHVVTTSVLGLDAILLSVALLGPEWGLARAGFAILLAVAVGWAVEGERETQSAPPREASATPSFARRFWRGLLEALDPSAPWFVLGLLIATSLAPKVSAGVAHRLPYPLQVPLFALVGLIVPATPSALLPMIATLLPIGATRGAWLALALSAPAANPIVLSGVARRFGRRAAAALAIAVVAVSIAAGNLTDGFIRAGAERILHGAPASLLDPFLVPLAALVLISLFRQGPREFAGRVLTPLSDHEHEHSHHAHHPHHAMGLAGGHAQPDPDPEAEARAVNTRQT
jgi:uncharacterized membrane protein YraQ (UPF0718 family)